MYKFYKILILFPILLGACTFVGPKEIPILEEINLEQIDYSKELKLSDICADVNFIKFNRIIDIDNGFRINKICSTKDLIIILGNNSEHISFFDRMGSYKFGLSDLMEEEAFMKPIDIKFNQKDNLLYVILEDNKLVVTRINHDLLNSKIVEISDIGSVHITEIVKLPDSDHYALSLWGNYYDFAMIKSFPIKKNALKAERSIYSRYNERVMLRNSFITDGNEYFFMKYQNDTLFKVSPEGLAPKIAFNFSDLVVSDNMASNKVSGRNIFSSSGLVFFNFYKDAFILKYLLNNEMHYLFRLSNKEFFNLKSENITNDVFGSASLNCIGVDPITGSFAFQIPSNTLLRYRNKGKDFINEKFFNQIDNLGITEAETTILVLLKLK